VKAKQTDCDQIILNFCRQNRPMLIFTAYYRSTTVHWVIAISTCTWYSADFTMSISSRVSAI